MTGADQKIVELLEERSMHDVFAAAALHALYHGESLTAVLGRLVATLLDERQRLLRLAAKCAEAHGVAVCPPRPAPTTVPSSGVPRQDSGRPKHGGGG